MYHINYPVLLTGLFTSIVMGASAQVTLDGSNLYPFGTSHTLADLLMPPVGPGALGEDMFWDFTSLGSDSLTEHHVYEISASPFPVVIPGDRVVVQQIMEIGTATHLSLSDTALLEHGSITVLGVGWLDELYARELVPPMVRLQLPAAYGQSYGGVSGSLITMALMNEPGEGVPDSLRVRTHLVYVHAMDGWGDVALSQGTYPVLRQNSLIVMTDSVDLHVPDMGGWQEGADVSINYERTYTYWSPTHGVPLVRFTDVGDDGEIDEVQWIHQDITTSVNNDRATNSNIQVFPNPAYHQATVLIAGTGSSTYRLMDMDGREVLQGRSTSDRVEIPLAHVYPGVYMLLVERGGTLHHQRLIVE